MFDCNEQRSLMHYLGTPLPKMNNSSLMQYVEAEDVESDGNDDNEGKVYPVQLTVHQGVSQVTSRKTSCVVMCGLRFGKKRGV